MWGRALRLCRPLQGTGRREYLSPAYKCEETWNRRKEAWALRSVKLDELYVRLDQKSTRSESIGPVDLDVFVNSATKDYLHEMRDLLHKMRNTAMTRLTLPSTQYAAVRCYTEADAFADLLHVLDDRLNYGLFLDRFTANMLFDRLLERRDFESAARVAGFLMLQENFEGPIAERFALYSAYEYLKTPPPVVKREETVAQPSVKKKKVEEIKIRVGYLRNPHFDDHFDIVDLKAIAGKTLIALTSKRNDDFSDDLNLWGQIFYGKYDKAKEVARKIAAKGEIFKETTDRIRLAIENCDEKNVDASTALKDIEAIVRNIPATNGDLESEIKKKLQEAIDAHENLDIEEHDQLLNGWINERDSRLREQLEKLEETRKEEEKRRREKMLKDIEERIWFFDNEEAVDLKIEQKRLSHSEQYADIAKTTSNDETEYIPPEIRKRK